MMLGLNQHYHKRMKYVKKSGILYSKEPFFPVYPFIIANGLHRSSRLIGK